MDDTVNTSVATDYVDISVVGMLRVIRQHWKSFVAFVTVCTGVSVAYAFLSMPIYKSTTLISPASGSTMAGGSIGRLLSGFGAGNMLGGMGIGAARNSSAVGFAALSSPYFTRAFIDDNNLLPVLFPDVWDTVNEEWLVDDPESIPTLQEGYELFTNEILNVEKDELGGLIKVSVSWRDPQVAADLANNLVASVNERLRLKAIKDADLTIEYLNEELAGTTAVELQQSLYFLIETEIEKRTVAKVRKEYSFGVISPATPSDLDKWESPNRVFVISVGIVSGIFFGLLFAYLLEPTRRVLRESR